MGDAGAAESNTHPEVLSNDYPSAVVSLVSSGFGFVQSYGWFILAAVLVLLYFRKKFESRWNQWQQSREDQNYKKYDAGTAQSRLEAMEKSRQRMQEQLDGQAAAHLEKMKKKEEEKRQQKIEDWDRHLEGKGYRSKYRPDEGGNASSTEPKPKPKPKKPLRDPDYNPLMGSGGGASYRPARRGGAGGG